MAYLTKYPMLMLAVSFFLLWLAAWLGAKLHQRWREPMEEDTRSDFAVVQAAALTLLGLIIGFSFSMATGRYDLRKNFEEAEANAIGTEYVRADLLPADEAPRCVRCCGSIRRNEYGFTCRGTRMILTRSGRTRRSCRTGSGLLLRQRRIRNQLR